VPDGALPGLLRVATRFARMPLRAGGVLDAADLARGVRGGRAAPVSSYPQESTDEEEARPVPGRSACPTGACLFDTIYPHRLVSLIAPPAAKTVRNSVYGIDPQIAASKSYLVVSMRDKVWFYDKSGHTLDNLDGSSANYPIPLCTLFAKLTPNINANLGLPTT